MDGTEPSVIGDTAGAVGGDTLDGVVVGDAPLLAGVSLAPTAAVAADLGDVGANKAAMTAGKLSPPWVVFLRPRGFFVGFFGGI